MKRIIEINEASDHANTLILRSTLRVTTPEGAANPVLDGALVLSGAFDGTPMLELRSAGRVTQVPFKEGRTPKIHRQYPDANNSANARIMPSDITGGDGCYELHLLSDANDMGFHLLTIYDRKHLVVSEKMEAISSEIRTLDTFEGERKAKATALLSGMSSLPPRDKNSLDFVQDEILLTAWQLKRPWMIRSMITDLRVLSHECDRQTQVAEFEETLHRLIYPLVLTNHAFTTGFEDVSDHGAIWSHVEYISAAIKTLGYTIFLNSGTLLGVVRENGLLKFDDDIDLGLVLQADNLEDAAQEWIALGHALDAAGLLEVPQGSDEATAGVHKLTKFGNLEIDLFPSWISADDRVFIYPHSFGALAKHHLLPFKPWGDTTLNIPNDAQRVLAGNYGENWRTPDKLFVFPWNEAKRVFRPFISTVRLK